MSPNEDGTLLLITVRRLLRSMAMSMDPAFTPLQLGLQPFAVKARYSAEDTPLPGERHRIPQELDALTTDLERRLKP